jgi:hypothetical protein
VRCGRRVVFKGGRATADDASSGNAKALKPASPSQARNFRQVADAAAVYGPALDEITGGVRGLERLVLAMVTAPANPLSGGDVRVVRRRAGEQPIQFSLDTVEVGVDDTLGESQRLPDPEFEARAEVPPDADRAVLPTESTTAGSD